MFTCNARYLFNLSSGINANVSVNVTDEDREGPLSSVPTEETDYQLILSWAFVLVCAVVALIRSSVGVRVWNTIAAIGRHEERQLRHLD